MSLPKPPSSLFLSLDLEMEQPSQEIIQIGAVIADLQTGEIVHQFSQLVTPKQPLSPFITQLTGITQFDMDDTGISLIEAYNKFLAFRNSAPGININPITWGGGDTRELQEQVKALSPITLAENNLPHHLNWPFGRRWLDVKTIFQFYMMAKGLKPQAGLAKAMTKVGLNFIGKKHNALCDAHNTFRLAHWLAKNGFKI